MIHIVWPWMAMLFPLPWLLRRLLPAAALQGGALFIPFAASTSAEWADATPSHSRLRSSLFMLVWLLLIAAAMRPQWLDEPLPVPTTGRQILLAIDVSGSMSAKDMENNRTRLNVVQKVAGEFISKRQGDQVGLILFGTQPYLQAPLTADLNTASQFLRDTVVGVAGTLTAIGDAIGLAIKRLHNYQKASGKQGEMVLILLTDGGNNAGLMDPEAAARMAASAGLRIYTIGVGALPQQNIFGVTGNVALDEKSLKSIARITDGEYFRASDTAALKKVYAQIDKLEPSTGKEQWYRPHSEWFIWPLAISLLLSVFALMIRVRT